MRWNIVYITAVCVIFLIKVRWPKNKSLYDTNFTQSRKESCVLLKPGSVQCSIQRIQRSLTKVWEVVSQLRFSYFYFVSKPAGGRRRGGGEGLLRHNTCTGGDTCSKKGYPF